MWSTETNDIAQIVLPRFQGILVDLMDELSRRLGFTFTIAPAADGQYGKEQVRKQLKLKTKAKRLLGLVYTNC